MKKSHWGKIALFFLCAPSFGQVAAEKTKENIYFKENVAIVDAYLVIVSKNEYAKQLELKDFAKSMTLPGEIIFNGQTFLDDGSGNDAVKGDGIYTTPQLYTTDYSKVKAAGGKLSVMKEAFVKDPSFKHFRSLGDGKAKLSGTIGMDCDITFGTCGCRADRLGWCNCCCFTLSNCSVGFSIGF